MTDAPLVMLVDDDPADVELTLQAMSDLNRVVHVVTARDGIEALDYLRESRSRNPNLILLDLNMPRKDGRELLREIKTDQRLADIPVVIHSTSTAPADVSDAYRLRANSYVSKAAELDSIQQTLGSVLSFWLETARLPDSR
ncbi:MAG: response regulator [Pseudomonadota bacterium]